MRFELAFATGAPRSAKCCRRRLYLGRREPANTQCLGRSCEQVVEVQMMGSEFPTIVPRRYTRYTPSTRSSNADAGRFFHGRQFQAIDDDFVDGISSLGESRVHLATESGTKGV